MCSNFLSSLLGGGKKQAVQSVPAPEAAKSVDQKPTVIQDDPAAVDTSGRVGLGSSSDTQRRRVAVPGLGL